MGQDAHDFFAFADFGVAYIVIKIANPQTQTIGVGQSSIQHAANGLAKGSIFLGRLLFAGNPNPFGQGFNDITAQSFYSGVQFLIHGIYLPNFRIVNF